MKLMKRMTALFLCFLMMGAVPIHAVELLSAFEEAQEVADISDDKAAQEADSEDKPADETADNAPQEGETDPTGDSEGELTDKAVENETPEGENDPTGGSENEPADETTESNAQEESHAPVACAECGQTKGHAATCSTRCSCGKYRPEDGEHIGTCILYACPDCGALLNQTGWTHSCGTASSRPAKNTTVTADDSSNAGKNETADADAYASNVGATAKFNPDYQLYVYLGDNPDNCFSQPGITKESFPENLELRINAYHIDGENLLFYKVEALPGQTLPSMLEERPWVYQNDLANPGLEEDTLILVENTQPEKPDSIQTEVNGAQISVSGELPEGATLSATVPEINGKKLPGVFDIKIMSSGKQWQPIPGETIKVSIPAPAGATTVDVYHFLEDPAIIKYMLDNSLTQALDVNFASDKEGFEIIEPAVKAFQQATGSSKICIIMEVFEAVPVIDGSASVDANGFSVFSSVDPIIVDDSSFTDLNQNKTYYVRPGEWLEFNGFTLLGSGFKVQSGEAYVEMISEGDGWLFSNDTIYFHVSDTASAGSEFVIKLNQFLVWGHSVRFEVVEDFDYGNVRIGVVGHDNPYPNEINVHANSKPAYYFDGENLSENDAIYSQNPNALIDIDGVKGSNDTVANDTVTVYGISDPTGLKTTSYFWTEVTEENQDLHPVFFAEIAEQIMAAYFGMTEHRGLDRNNYRLVPYVVKHETIGANAGWYVNCKIELKDTYLLRYDYNFPQGYDEFDIQSGGSKPNDTSIATADADANGNVTVTVGPYSAVTIKTELKNPSTSQTQEVTATLIAWCTTPDGAGTRYAVENREHSLTMSGNTTLYGVWEIDADGWVYNEFDWTIKNVLVDSDNRPVSGDTEFEYSLDFGAATNFPQNYSVYTQAGQFVETKQFGIDQDKQTLTFAITGNQYIVIENVPTKAGNSHHTFTVVQNLPVGYQCDSLTMTINLQDHNALITGVLETSFVNREEVFRIDYIAVGPAGETDFGTVIPESEELFVVTGKANGSEAQAGNRYRFVGWYADAACTTQLGTDAKFVPTKGENEIWSSKTYYAKFDYGYADLTISTTCPDASQSFIFTVTGPSGFSMDVVVHGNKSVTIKGLLIGTYTVTENTDWSWRYPIASKEKSITLTAGEENKVESSSGSATIYWLSGDSYCENKFTVETHLRRKGRKEAV